MPDISIQAFSDLIAVDEECALIENCNESDIRVVYIGTIEDCIDRFEDGHHRLVRKSDLQKEFDKQN